MAPNVNAGLMFALLKKNQPVYWNDGTEAHAIDLTSIKGGYGAYFLLHYVVIT